MIKGYESKGTNIACEYDYVNPENHSTAHVITEFGADFKPLPLAESYYPTRLEYFAGKALQGLVVGRAQKDLDNVSKTAKTAVTLAQALSDEIDSKTD